MYLLRNRKKIITYPACDEVCISHSVQLFAPSIQQYNLHLACIRQYYVHSWLSERSREHYLYWRGVAVFSRRKCSVSFGSVRSTSVPRRDAQVRWCARNFTSKHALITANTHETSRFINQT